MTDSFLIEELQRTAHFAAWQAGQVIRQMVGQERKIQVKGLRDLVTDTDHAAQAAALEAISKRHPDHRIVAEESAQGTEALSEGIVWLVDPLDGTSNYTTGLPMFSVSVGAAVDGEPVAGAIYDPIKQEFFLGAQGQGSSLNGRPLPLLAPRALKDVIISLDWAHGPDRRALAVAGVSALAGHCLTIRSLGSAALGLAYVACGRVGLYFNYGLWPWDLVAGAAIVREVGGDIFTPDGKRWQPGQREVFAGQPALLDEVLLLIEK